MQILIVLHYFQVHLTLPSAEDDLKDPKSLGEVIREFFKDTPIFSGSYFISFPG